MSSSCSITPQQAASSRSPSHLPQQATRPSGRTCSPTALTPLRLHRAAHAGACASGRLWVQRWLHVPAVRHHREVAGDGCPEAPHVLLGAHDGGLLAWRGGGAGGGGEGARQGRGERVESGDEGRGVGWEEGLAAVAASQPKAGLCIASLT
jgi:hypothetical protein